jgi:thioredoxin-like negative regulator of GroEL
MQTTHPSKVQDLVASSNGRLVVCFLKESGCPNCEQTAPVLAAMDEANPDTQFQSVTVKDGSEVTPGFQFRMFPGIFSFENGKLIRAFSGAKTARQLAFMFSNPNDMKVAAWDARDAATFIEKELAEYNQGCGYVAPVTAPVEAPVTKHVTPVVMPPSGDPNEEACDSCV